MSRPEGLKESDGFVRNVGELLAYGALIIGIGYLAIEAVIAGV